MPVQPRPSSTHPCAAWLLLWLLMDTAGAANLALEIQGVEGELLHNLQAGLSLAAEPCDAPPWRVRRLLRRADEELSRAARALGHYHIRIDDKTLEHRDQCWHVRFNISPGEPVRIQQVELLFTGEAQEDPAFARLREQSPLNVGAVLHHGHYERLKQDIERTALERGYFDGRFVRHELRVEPLDDRATVILHYDAGTRYRIGEINLHQDAYDARLLQRYLTIKPGDPYDSLQLNALHRALADSGYFESVAVRPDLQGVADGRVTVDVQLTPRKRAAYRVGVGIATDTGPRLSAAYERRRVNRRGHRFEASTSLSPVDSSVQAEYLIPLDWPHTSQIGLRSGFRRLDTDTSLSDTYTFGARLIGKRGGWSETRSLDWVHDRFKIGDDWTTSSLLVPAIGWTRTRADNRITPRRGYRLRLDLRGSHSALLSDVSFIQATAAAKGIYGLGKGRLLLRAELGLTETDRFERLPAAYRFFAGGDQSVRGYDYRSLAPKDADGTIAGGRYLATASVEYEHPVSGPWGVALFADAGDAIDSWRDGLRHAIGIGLRWRSPVGPLRLDLAFPSDRTEDDFRIHFSMGADL